MSRLQHSVKLGNVDVAQMLWDYKVVELAGNATALNDECALDAYGTQGFELVAIVGRRAYMKRLGEHGRKDA